jgi:GNAT superfamily N-acetyltransferase
LPRTEKGFNRINDNNNAPEYSSFRVRRAKKSDALSFIELLIALANFEHLEPPSDDARKRIIDDIFSKRRLGLLVAEETTTKDRSGIDHKKTGSNSSSSSSGVGSNKLVGYALFYFTYSSFLALPTFYLEDIFVLEDSRGRGVGSALFRECTKIAKKEGCGRMEWAVLTWNKKAIKFYEEKLGARRLNEWFYYRLTSDAIERLAGEKKKLGSKTK